MQLEAKEANMWMSELTGGGAYLESELTEEAGYLDVRTDREFWEFGGSPWFTDQNDHILALR